MERPSRGRSNTFPSFFTKIFSTIKTEVEHIQANETIGWQPQTRKRSKSALTVQHATAKSFARSKKAASTLKRHLSLHSTKDEPTAARDIPKVTVSRAASCPSSSAPAIGFVPALLKPLDTSKAANKLRQREKSPYPGAQRPAELAAKRAGTHCEPEVRIRGRTLSDPRDVPLWLEINSEELPTLEKSNIDAALYRDPGFSDPESDDAASDGSDDDDSVMSVGTSDCNSDGTDAHLSGYDDVGDDEDEDQDPNGEGYDSTEEEHIPLRRVPARQHTWPRAAAECCNDLEPSPQGYRATERPPAGTMGGGPPLSLTHASLAHGEGFAHCGLSLAPPDLEMVMQRFYNYYSPSPPTGSSLSNDLQGSHRGAGLRSARHYDSGDGMNIAAVEDFPAYHTAEEAFANGYIVEVDLAVADAHDDGPQQHPKPGGLPKSKAHRQRAESKLMPVS